jgi:hypothetical protein
VCEACRSPPFSADVKNVWSSTSTTEFLPASVRLRRCVKFEQELVSLGSKCLARFEIVLAWVGRV